MTVLRSHCDPDLMLRLQEDFDIVLWSHDDPDLMSRLQEDHDFLFRSHDDLDLVSRSHMYQKELSSSWLIDLSPSV